MTLSFIAPPKFDETHLDKLFKGIAARFRFYSIKINQKDEVIIINWNNSGINSIQNSISDYVNGFFAAIE